MSFQSSAPAAAAIGGECAEDNKSPELSRTPDAQSQMMVAEPAVDQRSEKAISRSMQKKLLIQASLFLITLTYVIFELRYNRNLLSLFSDANASKEAIDSLSNEGKLLAAIGITWAIGRGFLEKLRKPILMIFAFAAATWALYAGLSALYDKVIRDLSPATKVNGWHLAAYRQSLLNTKVIDPDIPLPAKSGAVGSIVMTSFPLVMFDERYMLPARDILERKATDFERYTMAKAEQRWPSYSNNMKRLDTTYREYLRGSAQAKQYGQEGLKEFKKRSGGMNPNPRASREEFLNELRGSSHPQAAHVKQWEADQVWVEKKGKANEKIIYGRDVPYFMNKAQYNAWFKTKADALKLEVVPSVDTVEQADGIHDINSAVFIPPMAMITSLLSIIANLAAMLVVVLTVALLFIRGGRSPLQRYLWILGPAVTIGFIVIVFSLAPSSIFAKGTPMRELEDVMHQEVGWPGKLWSKAAAIELFMFENTSFLGSRFSHD